MKANNSKKDSITGASLKDVIECDQARQKANCEKLFVDSTPPNPPALYEDSGEGYNSNFTFPQE